MKMWIAYNPVDDTTEAFTEKPTWWGSHKSWWPVNGRYLGILKKNYPGLTFSEGPIEVELSMEDVL